jgi:acetyl-CoA carboxylase biotin carboxyl carrier protein
MDGKQTTFDNLDIARVAKLMHQMRENGMTRLELEVEGLKLTLERGRAGSFVETAVSAATESTSATAAPAAAPTSTAVPASAPTTPAAPPAPPAVEAPVGHIVKSPIVGIFYASPSPDAAPFVSPGTVVTPGQTLCIIEAMKLMNEVNCPVAGTVAEVLVKNGDRVEYGQPMLRIV